MSKAFFFHENIEFSLGLTHVSGDQAHDLPDVKQNVTTMPSVAVRRKKIKQKNDQSHVGNTNYGYTCSLFVYNGHQDTQQGRQQT
jgi:hypothetical protein